MRELDQIKHVTGINMFALSAIKDIEISYDDLSDLQQGTNFPINEQEVKDFLVSAINAGVTVKVTDPATKQTLVLTLNNGNFTLT